VDFLIVLAILLVVVFVVSAPLRRAGAEPAPDPHDPRGGDPDGDGDVVRELAELEATRDAKYREIRDAELDYRTGKLSDEDFGAVDQGLRAEAVEILNALERVKARAGATIGER
jgi:hypothetical protein